MVKKDKERSTKHTHKTKDRVTRTLQKNGGELIIIISGQKIHQKYPDDNIKNKTIAHCRNNSKNTTVVTILKIAHCRNNSNIKYQNRRKRRNCVQFNGLAQTLQQKWRGQTRFMRTCNYCIHSFRYSGGTIWRGYTLLRIHQVVNTPVVSAGVRLFTDRTRKVFDRMA